MKEEMIYNVELSSILKRNLEELEISLKDINNEIMIDFLNDYLKNDSDKLFENILISQKAIRILKKKLNNDREKSAYQLGMTSGIVHVYKQFLDSEIADQEFMKKMKVLLTNEKTEKILLRLYNTNDIQSKVLVASYGTYTYNILDELIEINCIYKTKIGKYSFYNLTKKGKTFVSNQYAIESQHIDHYFNKMKIRKLNRTDTMKIIKDYRLKTSDYLKYVQEDEKCQILMK